MLIGGQVNRPPGDPHRPRVNPNARVLEGGRRLVEFMGEPDWAAEEIFRDRLARGENLDALQILMSDWISAWKVQDLYRSAQERRIPFAPVNTMRQLYESEHLRARRFFVSLDQPGVGRVNVPGAPSQK